MNPNRGENLQVSVPAELPAGAEVVDGAKNETHSVTPESAPSKQTTAPSLPTIPTDMPVSQAPVIPSDDSQASASDDQINADNPDRIERQWIDKAKEIVSQTKDDPYKQKSEMSKIKAEYIKTRFNKVLKTESEA